MRFLMLALCASLAGCAPTVELSKTGRQVELLSQAELGQDRMQCTQRDAFDFVVRQIEEPGSRGTVAQIRGRNLAAKKGHTHVLIWPGSHFKCDRDGREVPDGTYDCETVPATGYDCIVGR
ncbi:MAG: hypothetical protein R3E66_15580 [bacterium]